MDRLFAAKTIVVDMIAQPGWKGADTDSIRSAARRLGMSEFDFFRVAHDRWFGHSASEQDIERIFMDYVLHGHQPHWVRHLLRQMGRSRGVENGLSPGEHAPLAADTPSDPIKRAARIMRPLLWLFIIALLTIGIAG